MNRPAPTSSPVRLRVLFLINVNGKGVGGHYRSLRTTVEALSKTCDCAVVCIGRRVSPVLEHGDYPLHFVYCSGWDVVSGYRHLSSIVQREAPDVINSFDANAHLFGRLLGVRYKLPVVHTKCGGPNPRRYFPLADGYVVYSHENLEFFQALDRFQDIPIRFISNRVQPFECDAAKVTALRARLIPGVPCILRINRFSTYYEKSMLQCIRLVKRLNTDGHRVQLLFVGGAQEPEALKRVRATAPPEVHFVTDEEFTRDAKLILDVADFVVGTGRGLMEAACRGKALLTPLQDAEYPLLVTEDNITQLLRTNFSERNRVEGFDSEQGYQDMVKAVSQPAERERLEAQASGFFERYFNIENAVASYQEFLEGAQRRGGFQLPDLCLHAALAITHLYKTRHLNGA